MKQRYLQHLEFYKIVERAAQNCVCPEAAQQLRAVQCGQNVEEVRNELAKTDAMTVRYLRVGPPRLAQVQDILPAVQRAQKGGVLSMAELLLFAHTLRNFESLLSWYSAQDAAGPKEDRVLDDLFYSITEHPALSKSIIEAILSDTEMADTASDTLLDIRRKIRTAESNIRDRLEGMIKSPSTQKYLQDAVVSMRSGRFVVPVKAEFRGEVGGVIHDVSSSGATLFVEPSAVVELNARILQLRSQEQEEIERILEAFSSAASATQPFFGVSYHAMLEVDTLLAKAKLAADQGATMPAVTNGNGFYLLHARHPLLDRKTAVPVDIELGRDYDTMIITGPNTGGKTVSLKTAGLLLAMAACGFLIPASERSEVCLFREILVDIGDEQSIEQSLSTFSGHIKNIVDILKEAGPDTLVLLDELGAGTDPAEGASLAVSVIETLREKGSRIMATTHYGELKVFALETPGVQNAGCEFDLETLRPTYRLSVGVPGRSNAFLIGEKLGLPTSVIQRAQLHLSAEDQRFESVLGQLEDLKLEIKDDQTEIERLKYVAANQLAVAKEERDELIRQGEEALAAATRKAKELEQKVQDTAYGLMDEMKALQKQENLTATQKLQRARQIARRDAAGITEGLASQKEEITYIPLTRVKVGQVVMLAQLGQHATVKSLPDRNNMVEVVCGAIKTKVPLSGLMAAAEPSNKKGRPQPKYRSSGANASVSRSAAMEINLIGMTAEEAVMEAERFIDGAMISGMSTVWLIHGKGAGILRKALHAMLKGNKSVKSYRLGNYGEGEDGVTVVELK